MLAFVTPAKAEGMSPKVDKFRMWNDCRPLRVVLATLPSEADQLGLEYVDIKIVAEKRLQAAGIHSRVSMARLYINLNVAGGAFNVSVWFRKMVKDVSSGKTNLATTWQDGVTGTHGYQGEYIFSTLSRLLDAFVEEYLRVNAEDC
jgi:hypothetical protein